MRNKNLTSILYKFEGFPQIYLWKCKPHKNWLICGTLKFSQMTHDNASHQNTLTIFMID